MDDINKTWEIQERIERDIDYLLERLAAIGKPRDPVAGRRAQAIQLLIEKRRRMLALLAWTE